MMLRPLLFSFAAAHCWLGMGVAVAVGDRVRGRVGVRVRVRVGVGVRIRVWVGVRVTVKA